MTVVDRHIHRLVYSRRKLCIKSLIQWVMWSITWSIMSLYFQSDMIDHLSLLSEWHDWSWHSTSEWHDRSCHPTSEWLARWSQSHSEVGWRDWSCRSTLVWHDRSCHPTSEWRYWSCHSEVGWRDRSCHSKVEWRDWSCHSVMLSICRVTGSITSLWSWAMWSITSPWSLTLCRVLWDCLQVTYIKNNSIKNNKYLALSGNFWVIGGWNLINVKV